MNEIIEIEEDMRNNPDKYNTGSKPKVEEDTETLELYYQMTGRSPDDG